MCIVSFSGRTAVFNQEQLLLSHPSLISSSKILDKIKIFTVGTELP